MKVLITGGSKMYSRELAENAKKTIGEKMQFMHDIWYFPDDGPMWSERPAYEYDLAVFYCINRICAITGKSFEEICEVARNSIYYLNTIENHVKLYRCLPNE